MREKIFFVANSHIDLSWLWTRGETIHEVCPRTFQSVLKLMNDHISLRFSQSSAQIYEWMRRYYPELFEEIKKKVKDEQFEVVGGSWTEHNATILCEESLVRQYLLGKRFFMKQFGTDVKVGWLPDSFGFCWSLPQILSKCGIRYFLTHKLKWQVERMKPPIHFPYHLFWWKSADGSQVLSYHTVGPYNESLDQKDPSETLLAQLQRLKGLHDVGKLMVLFGSGDHGGGPTEGMLIKIVELSHKEGFPEICFSKAEAYFDEILPLAENLPTVNDELYVKTHRGTLTTEAMMKTRNRRCEVLLLTSERFYSIASLFGFKYPKAKIRANWKKLLFNQVHDNIDGTSIEQVYQDAATDYADVERFASRKTQLRAIGERINTIGKGSALIVFNPSSWKRYDAAKVLRTEIVKNGSRSHPVIFDVNGNEILSQVVEDEEGRQEVIFKANGIPALGYKVFRFIESDERHRQESDLVVDENLLENSFHRVEIDPLSNYAVKITDKRNARSVFRPSTGGNIIEVYEDFPPTAPDGEPAWNIYLGAKSNPEFSKSYVLEGGPLRGKIRIEGRFGNSKFLKDVVLYANSDKVDFELHIDWHERYRFAKASFPLNVIANWATYEMPYGVIQRYDHSLTAPPPNDMLYPRRKWERADMAKWEDSALRFVDVSDPSQNYGVSLLNDNKYGFSFEDNILRMSLVRGPRRGYRSTPESWADQSDKPRIGTHHIKYAIYPHKGDWRDSKTVRKGYEFNYPFQVIVEGIHAGDLPPEYSFLEVSPENVILTALKEAEDSKDLIIRLYESSGSSIETEIRFGERPQRVFQTDLMEWDKYQPKVEYSLLGNSVHVPISPWEVKTLRVQYLRGNAGDNNLHDRRGVSNC